MGRSMCGTCAHETVYTGSLMREHWEGLPLRFLTIPSTLQQGEWTISRYHNMYWQILEFPPGADPGFFKKGGGVHLRSTSEKGGVQFWAQYYKAYIVGQKEGGLDPPSSPIRPCPLYLTQLYRSSISSFCLFIYIYLYQYLSSSASSISSFPSNLPFLYSL